MIAAGIITFQVDRCYWTACSAVMEHVHASLRGLQCRNFTLAHWIGKGDPKINSGEPGILLNPAIYRGAWNSIRLAVATAFFTAFFGDHSRLRDRKRAGNPVVKDH